MFISPLAILSNGKLLTNQLVTGDTLRRLSGVASGHRFSLHSAHDEQCFHPMSSAPAISIVTPSFRSGKWLPLCIASVADQGVAHEHIVQDAGSDDGTVDWLVKDSRVTAVVEKDRGMYDAVNRGYRKSSADILAYLNCDEQYLPGALQAVLDYFQRHPETDILFGDCLVVDGDGKYICERRSVTPQLLHTWTASNLAFLTAATFIRRRVLVKHQLWFNTEFRDAGDQDWALRIVQAGLNTAVLPKFVDRKSVV